jgi:hypothetical protein
MHMVVFNLFHVKLLASYSLSPIINSIYVSSPRLIMSFHQATFVMRRPHDFVTHSVLNYMLMLHHHNGELHT